jgi:hypothetical protein
MTNLRTLISTAAVAIALTLPTVLVTNQASAHGGGHGWGGGGGHGGYHVGPGRIMGGNFQGGHRWSYRGHEYHRFGFGGYGGYGGGSCWKWSYTYGRRVNVCG